jgi:hypothetical protein
MSAQSPAHTAAGRIPAPGVRRLTGPVRAHVLGDPAAYPALAALRCGDARSDIAAREVEQTAARLVAGTTTMAQTAVVVEDDSGTLLGFASVHRRPPLGYEDRGARPWIADRYIVAFGRDRAHRDHPLRDSSTRIGEVIVRAALDVIALEAPGRPMPAVSALVRPENISSHRVLQALGFENLPMATTGFHQDLRWRERSLELPRRCRARSTCHPPRAPCRRPGATTPARAGPARSGRSATARAHPRAEAPRAEPLGRTAPPRRVAPA